MSFPSKLKTIAAAVMLATTTLPAYAVLERVGPTNNAPAVGGFPAWYQDANGLTLQFCDPKDQVELNGGWCLLAAADVAAVPEAFPNNFAGEHFYYAADASMTTAAGAQALLVLAVEGAFAAEVARPGEQVVFTRVRVRLTPAPVSGTYRFIHPYGEDLVEGVAGERITFTEDIGIAALGDFSGALVSRLGPFLTPSNTPGGAELPAVAGPSGLYLTSPGRIGPVTGSTLPNFTDSSGNSRNHNIFRLEGPPGSNLGGPGIDFIETTDFTLVGRLHTDAVPGRIDVKRANYSRNTLGNQLDVFANAFPTVQPRIPPAPKPAPILPQLTFFAAPCGGTLDPVSGDILPPFSAPAGAVATQMTVAGNDFWGESNPLTIPATVCVQDSAAQDALGNPVPAFVMKPVTDAVIVNQADYDGITKTLTVAAVSSDTVVPPALTLVFGTREVALAAGSVSVTPLDAPPAQLTVRSSAQGSDTQPVTLTTAAGAPPSITSTAGLSATVGLAYAYKVSVVDPEGGPIVFTLDEAPVGMTIATAQTLSAWIGWRPGTAQTGLHSVTVRATDPTGAFTTQTFQINVGVNLNAAPVANNDAYQMIRGTTLTVAAPGVLANDSDPDAGDTLTAISFSTPQVGTLAGGANGGFSYTPPATFSGLTSFSYRARDNKGLGSNAGFVAITVYTNRAPTTVDDTFVTSTNTPLLLNVLSNDSDLDTVIDPTNRIDPATVFIPFGNQPDQGGTVTVNADGSINYTHRAGFSGTERFSYAVRDTYSTPGISRVTNVQITVQ